MTDTIQMPTKGEYNDAIDKLDAIYGDDADALMSMISTTRDDELFHDLNAEQDGLCVGCMTEVIAVAVTRAVNGKAA